MSRDRVCIPRPSSIYAHATTDYSTYATYAISQKGCGPVVGDPNIPVQVQWKLVVCFNSSPTKMRQGMLPLPRSKKRYRTASVCASDLWDVLMQLKESGRLH